MFAAGVVLIVAPEQIPNAVDIQLDRSAFLVCYLLGSAELALAFLSYYSRTLTNAQSLRLIARTFIVFHAVTAVVEMYAFKQGGSIKLWANIAVRILVIVLFWYYGIRQTATQNRTTQNENS
jgi:hypothetical protein